MKKLNAKGFGALEAVLMVVILGIIGGAGYYVYNSQKKEDTVIDSTAKSQSEPDKTATPATDKLNDTLPVPVRDTSGIYLNVPEWGVKIQMSNAAKVTYEYDGNPGSVSNGEYESTLVLKVKPELLQDKSCSLSVGMYRTKNDLSNNPNALKVGEYYYFRGGSPYGCTLPNGQENVADNTLNTSIRDQFILENIYPK